MHLSTPGSKSGGTGLEYVLARARVAELCSIYSARDDDSEPRDCIMKVGEEMTMMNSAFVFRNKQTRSEKRVNQELATEPPVSIIPRDSADRERI